MPFTGVQNLALTGISPFNLWSQPIRNQSINIAIDLVNLLNCRQYLGFCCCRFHTGIGASTEGNSYHQGDC